MTTVPSPRQIEGQINGIIRFAVQVGLADDQNFAFIRRRGHFVEVTFENDSYVAIAMKNIPYSEIYDSLVRERSFNLKMLDGALIQLMYEYANDVLTSQRLAFFPSPYLEEFQNNPEVYQDDEVYANVVARNTVSFPVRFDYILESERHQEVAHPKSHLTLGQFRNCRIPVTAPLTPYCFVDFLLRNFYHTATERYAERLPHPRGGAFPESIVPAERAVVHVVLPK